ncbi:MAG: orotate phosphoribosyltransferase [Proteobacteria bacterium]|nr:orotate phosphoribosyltransferase [Pseudomonadota bacterium]
MSNLSKKLANIALEINAIKLNLKQPFTWASGFKMPIYNDNRLLLCNSKYRQLISEGFAELIQQKGFQFDVIAGTATAGIPHATTLADRLEKPLIYVRSSKKGHGLNNQIEGIVHAGQKVLLIEDLVSTGGSSITAVNAIRDKGGIVDVCFSIFSYGFPEGEKCFEDAKCKFFSLLTFDVLLEEALKCNYIVGNDKAMLDEWRLDPFGWGAMNGFPKDS